MEEVNQHQLGRTTVNTEIFADLKKAIIEYDKELATSIAKKVVGEGMDPIKALDAMTETIRQVGDGFGKGELWLPDLVGANEAMSGAMPIIEEELKKRGAHRERIGTVVLGTVYGDIHTIGKTMVSTLLTADGFTVYDLGVNVTAEEFMQAIKEHNADILAMSALMTTTASEQKETIKALKIAKIRDKIKVMVGGGAITQEFANNIGADGYAPTAPGAPKLARKLLGK